MSKISRTLIWFIVIVLSFLLGNAVNWLCESNQRLMDESTYLSGSLFALEHYDGADSKLIETFNLLSYIHAEKYARYRMYIPFTEMTDQEACTALTQDANGSAAFTRYKYMNQKLRTKIYESFNFCYANWDINWRENK